MYGYKTKHKILTAYLEKLKSDTPQNSEYDPKHTVLFKEFANDIGKKEPKSGYVAQQIFVLIMDGYLHYGKNRPDVNDIELSITQSGMNAALGETFKIKQHEFFWKAFMNICLTLANVAVAITAVWALTKDNDEVQKIEERLNKLEKVQEVKEAKANPNTLHLQNSNLPIPINSADSAKHTQK